MEKNQEHIHNSNVLFSRPNYDPNFNAPAATAMGRTQLAPDLMDYCIYVNLEVQIPSRPICGQVTNDSDMIILNYTASKNGKSDISFQQGDTTQGQGDFLTSSPSEIGRFTDIKAQSKASSEMFGINSINISYDNFMVPIVTIQFTDIKGASLFSPEEYRHSWVHGGMRGNVVPDVYGSFFKSFFTFPYPRFILTVKGFYGEPVTYELTCQDFRASFDSATGNFGATAKFVGQMFSVLNDITMGALFAAPLTTLGKKYWEQHAKEFVFNGTQTPMPTLIDVVKKIHDIKSTMLKAPVSNDLKEIQNKKQKLQNINNALLSYESALKKYFANEPCEYSNDNYIFYTHFSNTKDKALDVGSAIDLSSNDLSLTYDTLKQAIDAYNNKEISDINLKISSISNPLFNTINENKPQFTLKYCWAIDLGKMFKALSDEDQRLELNLKELSKTIDAPLSQKFYEALGWTPSVRNIVELLLAHLDTFINLVYTYANQVASSQDKNALYRKEGGSTTASYAFPLVSKITNDKEDPNLKKEETTWIGDYNPSAPEAVLVNSLLDALTDINANIVNIAKDGNNNDDSLLPSNILYHITPFDIEGVSSPFNTIDFKDISDLLGKIAIRGLSVLLPNNLSESDASLFGEMDAYNFMKYLSDNNVKSTQVVKLFGKNSTFNVNNIIDFLEQKIPNGESDKLAWKQSNYGPNSLMTINNSLLGGKTVDMGYFEANDGTLFIPINNVDWRALDTIKNNPLLVKNKCNDYLFYNSEIEDYGSFNIHVADADKYDHYASFIASSDAPDNIKYWYLDNFAFDVDKYKVFYTFNSNAVKYDISPAAATKTKFHTASVDGDFVDENNVIFPSKDEIFTQNYDFVVMDSKGFELAFGRKDGVDDPIHIKGIKFLLGYRLFNYRKLFLDTYTFCPYYYLLTIGGLLYAQSCQEKEFNKVLSAAKISDFTILPEQLKLFLTRFSEAQKKSLIDLFNAWIDSSFQAILSTYDILFDNNKDIKFAYSDAKYDNVNEVYSLKLNKNNEKLRTITTEFFQVAFVSNYTLKISNAYSSKKCPNFDIYLTSFMSKMKELYGQNSVVDVIASQDANQTNHVEALQISLYNYLKIIWDKWLSGSPKINNKTAWDFQIFRNNWHYLDSFYNRLSDEATINIQTFVDKIKVGFDKVNYNFLDFLSQVLVTDKYHLINVQNFADLVDDKTMDKMFTPIPFYKIKTNRFNHVSDIIVMYAGEASSKLDLGGDDRGDSYLIGGPDDQLPVAITSKTPGIGHKIPAFDVTYGGQYQSYFTDISVTQEKPQTTETALKAQFAISDAALNRETSKDVTVVGQDLFTIYSNTAYTCTVKMMGCAWVQPLMYFQLNNIPMFWGTYLIYQVSHDISAGQMVTTFTGQRMRPVSTPFVRNNIILSANNSNGGALKILNANAALKPSITNDCPYPYYPPLSVMSENNMRQSELNMTVAEYAKKRNVEWTDKWSDRSKFPSEEWQRGHTIAELIGVIVKSEANNQDELGKQLVCAVIYNRWKNNGHNLTKVLVNDKQFSLTEWQTWDATRDVEFINIANKIFYETPSVIKGSTTYIREPVPIWDRGVNTNKHSESLTLSSEDLLQIDGYATTKGYNTNYKNPRSVYNTDGEKLEPIPIGDNIPVWHASKYICQHDSKDAYGHVFISSTNAHKGNNFEYESSENVAVTKTNLAQSIFNSIKLTIGDESKQLSSTVFNQDKNQIMITSTNNKDVLCTVFDVAISTYKDHLAKIMWIIMPQGDSVSEPASIVIEPKIKGTNVNTIVAMGKIVGDELSIVRLPFNNSQFNDNFKKIITKNYHKNIDKFAKECTNFNSSQYGDLSSLNEVFKECFNTIITSCTDSGGTDFIWDANNGSGDLLEPVRCNDKLNINGAVDYLKDNLTSSSGHCARAVRKALMNNGNMSIQNWPLSACVYHKHLPFWGFDQVAEGTGPTPIEGYTPQKGDIAVIAASKNHIYGHVQMYDGEGKWLADRSYNKPWCYNILGVPYKIFRHQA